MSDLTFLEEAIKLAREYSADGRGGPFGAVVVQDGKVMGRGWNQVVEARDPTAHAEILAIRDAALRMGNHVLSGCTIYCSCEPCPMCMAAIYWARIADVVYAATASDARAAGFDDDHIAQELVLPPHERTIPVRQALREEGKAVLEAWQKNPKRREY